MYENMSTELRLKKLRGSGGFVMARVTDEQQSKGNLGGPDLFLAPIGRLESELISKHTCNTCEKEFEGSPKIEFENPNEEVAENLVLAERGKYLCNQCGSTIAEYREFRKPNEAMNVGLANPIEQQQDTDLSSFDTPVQQEIQQPETIKQEITTEMNYSVSGTVRDIVGMDVFDESAKRLGKTIFVGVPDNKISIYSLPLAFNKILKVSHGGDSEPDKEIPRYVNLVNNGKINFDDLITHEFNLDKINDAISLFRSGLAGRIIIEINKE